MCAFPADFSVSTLVRSLMLRLMLLLFLIWMIDTQLFGHRKKSYCVLLQIIPS